jgi:hypothetical protein
MAPLLAAGFPGGRRFIASAGSSLKARTDIASPMCGYTIVNDVTARDRQRNHKQWFLGKALDTFCPMGPWIATSDNLDPENLDVKCWVNGEISQNANTSDLIFGIPTLVATISAGLTLKLGDVICKPAHRQASALASTRQNSSVPATACRSRSVISER